MLNSLVLGLARWEWMKLLGISSVTILCGYPVCLSAADAQCATPAGWAKGLPILLGPDFCNDDKTISINLQSYLYVFLPIFYTSEIRQTLDRKDRIYRMILVVFRKISSSFDWTHPWHYTQKKTVQFIVGRIVLLSEMQINYDHDGLWWFCSSSMRRFKKYSHVNVMWKWIGKQLKMWGSGNVHKLLVPNNCWPNSPSAWNSQKMKEKSKWNINKFYLQ